MEGIMIDTKMRSKVEFMSSMEGTYNVKFKDLDDTFWFETKDQMQEFMNKQSVERFYDKELRKGYFDHMNEHEETFRYHVSANRGNLTLIKEEFIEN